MRPSAAMHNPADSLTDNLIPAFPGRLQGSIIGLDNNPIRPDHQDRILDGVKQLLPGSGMTFSVGITAVTGGYVFWIFIC